MQSVLLALIALGLLAGCGAHPAGVSPGSAAAASSTESVSGQPATVRVATKSSVATVATSSTSGPGRPMTTPSFARSEASTAEQHTATPARTLRFRGGAPFTPTPVGGIVLVRPRQLTAEDSDATVRLRVGDTFSVSLPAPTFNGQAVDRLHPPRWTVGISNPVVLVRVGDDGPGTFRAVAAGTATLAIEGQPSGLPSDEPPLPVGVELVVHVVVA